MLGPEADGSDDDADDLVSDEQFFTELKRRASTRSLVGAQCYALCLCCVHT